MPRLHDTGHSQSTRPAVRDAAYPEQQLYMERARPRAGNQVAMPVVLVCLHLKVTHKDAEHGLS
jgi:hypothetical protein